MESIVPSVALPPATAVDPLAVLVTSQVTVVLDDPETVAVNCWVVFSVMVTAVSLNVTTTFVGVLLQPDAIAAHTRLNASQNFLDLMIAVPPTVSILCMLSVAAVSFFRMSGFTRDQKVRLTVSRMTFSGSKN